MNVAIDARLAYYSSGGIAQYTLHLIQALARLDLEDRIIVLQSRKDSGAIFDHPKLQRHPLWTPCHHRFEQWTLPLELSPMRLDLLHSPDFIPPFHRRCKSVITIHDLAFLRFPDLITEESERYYRHVKRAIESADGIITVSENTRKDVEALLGVPSCPIEVIYHAPDERLRPLTDLEPARKFAQARKLPDRFILWVGTLEPRKNLKTLLEAVALLRDKGRWQENKLVAVGTKGWLYQSTLDLLKELRLQNEVILFGPASLDELLLLYNLAWVFVFPSLYEGFGFPPLEAMACGIPVISAQTSSLPEVLGEAAIYLDPLDPEAWAEALWRLENAPGLRGELQRRGLEQAAKFSWQKTAEKTLAFYHHVFCQ